MNLARQASRAEITLTVAGAMLTVIGAYAAVHSGLAISSEALLAVALFVGSLLAYLRVPHLAIALTVPLFAFLPTLKVFVGAGIGGAKDIVDLAAICAMVILAVFERRQIDRWVAGSVMVLLALYVINPGHPHNAAWAQGVRLTGEPLLLLLVGLSLPNPRRNFRYAAAGLVATGCIVALYGLFQQLVGPGTLVSWGYSYAEQVRTAGSLLRSFGTLDDPFDYAIFLLYALGAVVFWYRRGPGVWSAAVLLMLGVVGAFVRTAALILVGFLGLQMVRWHKLVPAVFLSGAALVAATPTVVGSTGTQTTKVALNAAGAATQGTAVSVPYSGSSVLLNGRISAWAAALGSNPGDWLFGRGVGKVGTAASRARYTFVPAAGQATGGQAVDSGYLATVADIGLLGLAVELALFMRLIVIASRRTRSDSNRAWATLSLIVALLLYALTRDAFTAFPTAFLGLLLIGVGLAPDDEERAAARGIRPGTS